MKIMKKKPPTKNENDEKEISQIKIENNAKENPLTKNENNEKEISSKN